MSVSYYSTWPPKYGTLSAKEIGTLPVNLPPHRRDTYLKGGTVVGSGSSLFYLGDLEVSDALPVLEQVNLRGAGLESLGF